jgi:hypothetical protein
VVLTGAHCDWNFETNEPLNSFTLQKETVRVGAIANSAWSSFYTDGKRNWTIEPMFEDDAIEVAVANQSYFPGFDINFVVGDLLLLHLEEKVCIDGPSLMLNEDSNLPLNGTSLSVLGMGFTEQDESLIFGSIPPRLMDTTYNVIDRDSCDALREEYEVNYSDEGENFTLFDIDDKSMICTIYLNDEGIIEGGQAACFGDSGGPVVYVEEDGNHTLMGTVSWGYDICGVSYFPDVIARVSFGMDWIKTVVCDEWEEEATFCPQGLSSCSSNSDEEDRD